MKQLRPLESDYISRLSSISPESEIGFSSEGEGLQQSLVHDRYAAKVAESDLTMEQAATFPVSVMRLFIAFFQSSNLGIPPPFPEVKSFDDSSKTPSFVGMGVWGAPIVDDWVFNL